MQKKGYPSNNNKCPSNNNIFKILLYFDKERLPQIENNYVRGVYASADGTRIYAAATETATVDGGLSVSTDSGASWTNYTATQGLLNNKIYGVYASADGTGIYVATFGGGLSMTRQAA